MKKKIIIITIISAILLSFPVYILFLKKDARIKILDENLSNESYESIYYLSSRIQTKESTTLGEIETVSVYFGISNTLRDQIKDSLKAKSDVEKIMRNNSDVFSETFLKIIIECPYDSGPDIIEISNYEFDTEFVSFDTEFVSSDMCSLSYGYFFDREAIISDFDQDSRFEHLTLWVDNAEGLQALDTQSNLSELVVYTKTPITADEEDHLKKALPDCTITVNRKVLE